jgi:hypothetical protein
MRQWVLSFPFPLRFLFASRPEIMGRVLGIVYRVLSTHLTRMAGHAVSTAHSGAVTLIQRFGGALNLNVHLMCMDARMPRAHGCAGTTTASSHPTVNTGHWLRRLDAARDAKPQLPMRHKTKLRPSAMPP